MKLENIVCTAIILVIFAILSACEVARWNECRRYHPVWYCLDRK